ncbi:MAG: 50S ribosomal protein L10 [Planctomycetota bacterium]
MSKEVKQMMIDSLGKKFAGVNECIIVDISTLDSAETFEFRSAMRKNQVKVTGVKGALARKALKDSSLKGVETLVKGPSFVATGASDVVALAKALVDWAKKQEKVAIKGAVFEGQVLGQDGVISLSKMPSRQDLLSGIAGLIAGCGSRLASQLKSPASNIAGAVQNHVKKLEEGGAAA